MSQTTIPKEYYGTSPDTAVRIAKWWTLPPAEIGQAVNARVKYVDDKQSYRRGLNERHARLYSNLEFQSLTAGRYNTINVSQLPQNRVTWNLAKACVDTAASQIAKNKPLPLFLTEKGVWSKQQKAKKLSQFVAGVFDQNNTYKKGRKVFKHAGIYGTGAMKAWPDYKAGVIKMDWVYIHEVIVEEVEAFYGNPRCLYHRCVKPRELVLDMFGTDQAKKDLIAGANPANAADIPHADTTSDMIELVEAWHLPSSEDATDGKHVISVSSGAVLDEEYNKSWFPIVFFKWSEPVVGFYGNGIIHEVEGTQVEINKLLRDIGKAQNLMSVPRVFVESSTTISQPISNEIGSQYRYNGSAPIFSTVPAMHPEIYQHLERLWNKGFEQVGISQLSATSKKPAGLDSGKALREYNDIETERFILVGQDWEDFYLQLAKIVVSFGRDLATSPKSENGLRVRVKGQKFMQTIKWKDVDLDEDAYIMQAFPTSFLRTTPSGRLEDVQDLLNAGLIGKDVALLLLDFPDLAGFMSLQNSSLQVTLMMMEKIVEDGVYVPPEPFMDLNSAMKIAQNTYNQAKLDGAPEKNLELLIQFMNQCNVMLQRASTGTGAPTNQPALPAAPAEGAPPAGPGGGGLEQILNGVTPAAPQAAAA